jgi:hypothetical protein
MNNKNNDLNNFHHKESLPGPDRLATPPENGSEGFRSFTYESRLVYDLDYLIPKDDPIRIYGRDIKVLKI